MDMQPGDVVSTYADITSLQKDTDFIPSTPLRTGIEGFVKWYLNYYSAQLNVTVS